MAVDLQNTKFSDIDLAFVKGFLRIEPDFTEDDIEISLFLEAAKGFVLDHSQLTVEDLDNNKSANILCLKLISDFYQNRGAVTNGTNLAIDPIFAIMLKNLKNYTNFFGIPEDGTV